MCKLDLSKPVQTQDGDKVRILCTDKKGPVHPVVALVERDGIEYVVFYNPEGTAYARPTTYNLVNIPEVRKNYRLIRNTGTQSAIVYHDLNEVHRHLLVSDDRWIGLQETVFTDGKITQINFIPR